jgi:small-conductance mechanosensitive channel
LAFGVGMKLTHGSGRPPAAPELERGALGDRVDAMERRLARVEKAPAALTAPAAPGFDQKVLEAVVEALEARLQEQAAQWEKRTADLESRMAAENKALDQQDRTVIAACQERIADVQAQWSDQLEGLRGQFAAQSAALETRVVSMQRELAEELPLAVEKQVTAGAGAIVEKKLGALVEEKNREVADLRRQLAETDRRVSEALDSIGRILRQAADRLNPQPSQPATPQDPPQAPSGGGADLPSVARPRHLCRLLLRPALALNSGADCREDRAAA